MLENEYLFNTLNCISYLICTSIIQIFTITIKFYHVSKAVYSFAQTSVRYCNISKKEYATTIQRGQSEVSSLLSLYCYLKSPTILWNGQHWIIYSITQDVTSEIETDSVFLTHTFKKIYFKHRMISFKKVHFTLLWLSQALPFNFLDQKEILILPKSKKVNIRKPKFAIDKFQLIPCLPVGSHVKLCAIDSSKIWAVFCHW